MAIYTLPDQAYLIERFIYDPQTGTLTWRERPLSHFRSSQEKNRWNTRYAGTLAGMSKADGYREVRVDKHRYGMHRLIWKMVTGKDPLVDVDHKNHIPSDNRWDNLRSASKNENQYNASLRKDNTSGFKGVFVVHSKITSYVSYMAFITVDGKRIQIGTFATAEAAHAAYCAAGKRLHGEFFFPATDGDDVAPALDQ